MFAFADWVFDEHGFPLQRSDITVTSKAFLGAAWYAHSYRGQGVLVYDIVEGSPAERAGLEVGDTILTWEGQSIARPNDLSRFIRAAQPGQTVKLTVIRGTLAGPLTMQLDDGSAWKIHPITYGIDPPKRLMLEVTLGSKEDFSQVLP